MKQARNYHAGLAAEDCVLRDYQSAGYLLLMRRFRHLQGEIDLILRQHDLVVFVEVKKSKDFETALRRITSAQISRIFVTASAFLACQPLGQLTDIRFDLALVDGRGSVRIMENALHQ
ncbi:MAG: YraN family protein [Roseinatronobacter sp.]